MPKRGPLNSFEAACRSERHSMDRLAGAVALLLNVPRVLIGIFDDQRGLVVGSFSGELPAGSDDNELLALCHDIATGNRPILLQDTRRRTHGSPRALGSQFISCAGVPLTILDGMFIGAIAVCDVSLRNWQDRDVVVLRCFGEAFATVIDARLRHEQMQREQRRTSRNELATAVNKTTDLRRTIELETAPPDGARRTD